MASTYSTHLRFEKQATGENEATWGTRLNTVIDLIEDATAGMETLDCSGGSDITLSTANSAVDQQRMAILKCTGAMTANINIITPDNNTKHYIVWNATTGSYTVGIKTTSGTALDIPQGDTLFVVTDGTNYVDVTAHPTLGTAAYVNTGTGAGDVPTNADLGTAGAINIGTAPDEVPTNELLGTAAQLDTGTADAQIPTNANLGTASTKNTGTSSGQVPLNSDLGTASLVNTGTGSGDVPLNSNLGTASLVNTGTGSTQVPLNASLGTAAYVNTGTSASNVPTVTNGNTLWLGIGAKAADSEQLDGLDGSAYAQLGTTQTFSGTKTFSAVTRFASGTAASPSISFSADTNTGMFSKSADTIGWACAGTERMYLTSAGDLVADGNITGTSDLREKDNIKYMRDTGGAVERVKRWYGITFTRKGKGSRRECGLGAQHVQKSRPEAVFEDPETGKLSVAYGNLAGDFTEAIYELDARLSKLEG